VKFWALNVVLELSDFMVQFFAIQNIRLESRVKDSHLASAARCYNRRFLDQEVPHEHKGSQPLRRPNTNVELAKSIADSLHDSSCAQAAGEA
jgi:hypothetical protein